MLRIKVYPAWDDSWEWAPGELDRDDVIGPYLVAVLTELLSHGVWDEFEFQVCWGDPRRIVSSSSRKLVIFHRGDERSLSYQYPPCHCVFREYLRTGFKPDWPDSWQLCGSSVEYLRDRLAAIAKMICAVRKIYSIPIGFANAMSILVKPIQERRWDVSFAGSVSHRAGFVRNILDAKKRSRTWMLRELKSLKSNNKSLAICDKQTPCFGAVESGQVAEYKELLAETKIALVPRGTSLETFRHFEAAQAGCIVLTDGIPNTWYFDKHPFLVTSWARMPGLICNLLRNESRLNEISDATRKWWKTVEPNTLAAFVRSSIRGH